MFRWIGFGVVGGYVGLRFVSYIYEKKKLYKNPKSRFSLGEIIAHRGGRDLFIENSVEAFEQGCKIADAVELDVWLTKDDKVVVFHDDTLDRVCGVAGNITDYAYCDLPKISAIASDGFNQGCENTLIREKSTKIPLLEDVLDVVAKSEKKLMLEFKHDSRLLASKVRDMLYERNLVQENKVQWFSLKHGINNMLRDVDPEIKRGGSVLQMIYFTCMYHLGLLPLVDIDVTTFGVTLGKPEENLSNTKKLPVVKHFPISVQLSIATFYDTLQRDHNMIKYLQQKRNLTVWVLGVNNEERYKMAKAMGADSLLTDRPEWLAEHVRRKD